MSQNNSNDKTAMLAVIGKINEVAGFEPSVFAVDYTDLTTGEVRKRLPVMTQIAWFRMKYPEGKIAVSAVPNGDCFVATAKISIWQKQQRLVLPLRTNLRSPQGNGRRQRQSAWHCAMPDSVYSSLLREKISPSLRLMS